MNSSNASTGTFTFSVDSSLLFQLGEQLVAKPSVALAELIKNSYDADATSVNVILENVGVQGGTIVIEDNGHGMLFEEIEIGWMRIATTEKFNNPQSRKYCRALTGAKGVGRFAARRLGEKLLMQSIALRPDGQKEAITVEFDWVTFVPGEDINHIPIPYRRDFVSPDTQTGVSLFIEGARDAWTEFELNDLRRDLLSLQTPFPDLIIESDGQTQTGCETDPGFDLTLNVNKSGGLQSLSGSLSEEFLNDAWGRLDGEIDDNGVAKYDLSIMGEARTQNFVDDVEEYGDLHGVKFRIYFFIYKSGLFEDSVFGVREASRKGREEGGVRVYLDGFRVTSYGQPGDDWLRLDEYAVRNIDLASNIPMSERLKDITSYDRPYLLIPRNRQLFGAVVLSQTNHRGTNSSEGLQITISRERLVATPTFSRLTRFLQRGIYWMTLNYAAWRVNDEAKPLNEGEETAHDILVDVADELDQYAEGKLPLLEENNNDTSKDQNTVDSNAKNAEQNKARFSKLSNRVRQANKKVEEQNRAYMTEVSMLRLLASAGTAFMIIDHQLRTLISNVQYINEDLSELEPLIPDDLKPRYKDINSQVYEWEQMVSNQVAPLGFLLSEDARLNKDKILLHSVTDKAASVMSYYMKKYDVSFQNQVPDDLRTPPMFEAELHAIFMCLLSNALKAVRGKPNKRILVTASKLSNGIQFTMMNTGKKLPPDRWEISFNPFITDSDPDPLLGVGTGMGLKLVKDFVSQYRGIARFIAPSDPWQTCIEIFLPN